MVEEEGRYSENMRPNPTEGMAVQERATRCHPYVAEKNGYEVTTEREGGDGRRDARQAAGGRRCL